MTIMTDSEDRSALFNCNISTSHGMTIENKNMLSILMIVRCNKLCWDNVILTSCSAVSQHCKTYFPIYETQCNFNAEQWNDYLLDKDYSRTKIKEINKNGSCSKKKLFGILMYKLEGLYFSVFLRELQCSKIYRLLVITNLLKKLEKKNGLKKKLNIIHWHLQDNLPYIIDYEWNVRMTRNALERQHLDTAMSWLSTLGGACSALGDYDIQFAEKAGKISYQQMDIALRVGDPGIVSRCRLYIAISLIQQCRFKIAASIIKHEYRWAYSNPAEVRDQRLINMCHGIWTKLKYERKVHEYKNVL